MGLDQSREATDMPENAHLFLHNENTERIHVIKGQQILNELKKLPLFTVRINPRNSGFEEPGVKSWDFFLNIIF